METQTHFLSVGTLSTTEQKNFYRQKSICGLSSKRRSRTNIRPYKPNNMNILNEDITNENFDVLQFLIDSEPDGSEIRNIALRTLASNKEKERLVQEIENLIEQDTRAAKGT